MALVKYNNNSLSAITATAGMPAGAMTLIKEQTASSSATIDFLNGTSDVVFDGTYPIYIFKFIDIHPATDNVQFQFQVDTGTNTSYNQSITSTYFDGYHSDAAGDDSGITYRTSYDQANGTAFQTIAFQVDNANDGKCDGTLQIFSPSSSTFVKHFISDSITKVFDGTYTSNNFCAGYVNTTTALTRVQFKFSSGNIDSGTIKLYGIKDS